MRMDAESVFFVTQVICSFHGMATRASRRWRTVFYFKLAALGFIFIINIFSLYLSLVRASRGSYSVTEILRFVVSSVMFKLLYDLQNQCSWLDDCISYILINLSEKQLSRIFRFDLVCSVIISIVHLVVFSAMMFAYFTGQFSGIRTFIAGPEDGSPDAVIFILIIQNQIAISCVLISSLFYIQIQYLLGLYCESVNQSVILSKRVVLDRLVRRCRYINHVRKAINRSLGFIPLAAILCIWLYFVFGLSFAYIYDNIKYNGITLALTAGLIIMGLVMLESLNRSVVYFGRAANQLRETCARLSNNEEVCYDTTQFRMARLLHNFLTGEKLPPMMAYDLVQMRPNLTLSLLDSMISFTVMMMTSFRVYVK